ncbi:hypothetical protein DSN97_07175 [Deferribacteraceae bacterium V6Fe1]|nr:hypothetical protein DSN97_07175 [Deferribacteraceae bacterium V6Fe1]
MKKAMQTIILCIIYLTTLQAASIKEYIGKKKLSYQIVDTGVTEFYSNTSSIPAPKPGEPFYGQDAQYQINPPSYVDNGDGTITDKITGLMWQNTGNRHSCYRPYL